MSVLWQKSAQGAPQAWFMEFTSGKDRGYDLQLQEQDLMTNAAQAVHLFKTGLISESDANLLLTGIRSIWHEFEQDIPFLTGQDEDVHSALENALTKQIGRIAGVIHTGRSRNDQVLCDIRLFVRKNVPGLLEHIFGLFEACIDFCERNRGRMITGFTHTRPAMPSSADAWLEGFMDVLWMDLRSIMSEFERFDRCPLGSAAGYGVPEIPVDRDFLSLLLGFSEVQVPVTAVQLSRGTDEAALISRLASFSALLGRLATDVISHSGDSATDHFSLSGDQTSGSSIMPQKRNPDVWELIRANSSQFKGWSAQLDGLTGSLGSGYHRDLQPVKGVLMDALKHAEVLFGVSTRAVDGLSVKSVQLDPAIFTTQRANEMVVENGIPFREAYRNIGDDQESWKKTTPGGFSSYRHTGSPGTFHPGAWRERIQDAREVSDAISRRYADALTRLRRENLHVLYAFDSTFRV